MLPFLVIRACAKIFRDYTTTKAALTISFFTKHMFWRCTIRKSPNIIRKKVSPIDLPRIISLSSKCRQQRRDDCVRPILGITICHSLRRFLGTVKKVAGPFSSPFPVLQPSTKHLFTIFINSLLSFPPCSPQY